MQVAALERIVLGMLFPGDDAFSTYVRDHLDDAVVTERWFSGAGFFSTIEFPGALPDWPEQYPGMKRAECQFEHPAMKHGGGLMASSGGPAIIELEGYNYADPWPEDLDMSQCSAPANP